jgi:hypothetical protein
MLVVLLNAVKVESVPLNFNFFGRTVSIGYPAGGLYPATSSPSSSAKVIAVLSSYGAAITCRPTGKPSEAMPAGTVNAGSPATDAWPIHAARSLYLRGPVAVGMVRSSMGRSSGGGAVVNTIGHRKTSTSVK